MPRSPACLVLALLLLAGEAGAQADLAKATCAGLNELRRAERAELLLWLQGYYAGAAQRSTVDRQAATAAMEAVEAACASEPGMVLIGGDARALFLGERRGPPASAAVPAPVPSSEAPRSAAPASARPTPVR